LINRADLFGNLNIPFSADLLQNQRHREERSQVVGANGLACARVEYRRRGLGQIGLDIIPGAGDAILRQKILNRVHKTSLLKTIKNICVSQKLFNIRGRKSGRNVDHLVNWGRV
jgi:hypothetical protein